MNETLRAVKNGLKKFYDLTSRVRAQQRLALGLVVSVSIALIAMTCFHPGFVMGEVWHDKVGAGGKHTRINSTGDAEAFVYNGGMEGAYELGSSPGKTRSFMPAGGVKK